MRLNTSTPTQLIRYQSAILMGRCYIIRIQSHICVALQNNGQTFTRGTLVGVAALLGKHLPGLFAVRRTRMQHTRVENQAPSKSSSPLSQYTQANDVEVLVSEAASSILRLTPLKPIFPPG
jgi:hypothetical protein